VLADKSDVGTQYNGGFIAPGLFAGIEVLGASDWDRRIGWVTGVYARTASVMSVFDVQLEYSVTGHVLAEGPVRADMVRHSLSSSVNLHPFFLRLIAADYASRVLSAMYLQLGLSAEIMDLRSDDSRFDRNDVAFSLHWGAGVDVPLGNPNGHGTFWLGVNWRWKFVYLDPKFYGHDDTDAHQLVLVLTYRFNNTSFTRVERPQQLRWRQ
ncbi:MAG: hypothetical protein VX223_04095, partial [Myxococcota bacterium]|nr:hypothetical protein [Myxococcota bacterium]